MNNIRKAMKGLRYNFFIRFSNKPVYIPNDFKAVSITFDDVHISALEEGIDILDAYEVKGTFYIAGNHFFKAHGRYGLNKIDKAINNRHELGCHTFNHVRIGSSSLIGVKKEVESNKNFMYDKFGIIPQNFSFPYGSIGITSKAFLLDNYCSLRTTYQKVNRGHIDIGMLSAYKLYDSEMNVEDVNRLTNNIKQNGGWLILYMHDVKSAPSKYGCSPDLLNQAILSCSKSGLEILSIQNVLIKLGVHSSEKNNILHM